MKVYGPRRTPHRRYFFYFQRPVINMIVYVQFRVGSLQSLNSPVKLTYNERSWFEVHSTCTFSPVPSTLSEESQHGTRPPQDVRGIVFQLRSYFYVKNDENAKSCRPILPGWKIIDYKRSLENTI